MPKITKNELKDNINEPIELFQEEISDKKLYLRVFDFESYEDVKKIINSLDIMFKTTTQNDGVKYSVLIGPIENKDANKLVSSFISKGYKKTKIIIK